MPRFQLLVQELGREPRAVPLGAPIVVGRSRGVDLTIADEEVGRKQFRIEVTSGFVVLEGLGSTNPTRIDDATIQAGEKTTVQVGAQIRVGKTVFTVEHADKTEDVQTGPRDVPDATMVAKGPGPARPAAPPKPAAPAPAPAEAEAEAEAEAPMNTMEFRRPGAPGGFAAPKPPAPPAAKPNDAPGAQEQTAAGGRPGAPASGAADRIDVTMQVKGPGIGGRPQPKAPPKQTTKPTPTQVAPPRAAPPPAAPPPAAPRPAAPAAAAPPPPATPPAAPPQPQTAPAAPAPQRDKPKTVAVRPEDMAPIPGAPPAGNDVEARLHQTLPRLFVKSAGLKRRLRLMKAENSVGRAESADVLLPHESVSERHANLRFDGERWLLQDLGSTNGCIVDGAHVRQSEVPLRRNALIGVGALHVIFLCSYADSIAADRREEDRALQHLVKAGRVSRDEAAQIRRLTRADNNQSVAEILLNETALGPIDWANAIDKARNQRGLLAMILGLFSRR